MDQYKNDVKFINVYCKMIKQIKQSKFSQQILCKVITIRDNKNNVLQETEDAFISVPQHKLSGLCKRFFRITVTPEEQTYNGHKYYQQYYSHIPKNEFQMLNLYELSNKSQFNLEIQTESDAQRQLEEKFRLEDMF